MPMTLPLLIFHSAACLVIGIVCGVAMTMLVMEHRHRQPPLVDLDWPTQLLSERETIPTPVLAQWEPSDDEIADVMNRWSESS